MLALQIVGPCKPKCLNDFGLRCTLERCIGYIAYTLSGSAYRTQLNASSQVDKQASRVCVSPVSVLRNSAGTLDKQKR